MGSVSEPFFGTKSNEPRKSVKIDGLALFDGEKQKKDENMTGRVNADSATEKLKRKFDVHYTTVDGFSGHLISITLRKRSKGRLFSLFY